MLAISFRCLSSNPVERWPRFNVQALFVRYEDLKTDAVQQLPRSETPSSSSECLQAIMYIYTYMFTIHI